MSRRSIEKRLEGLLARAQMRTQGVVPVVDATVLVTAGTWEAFVRGDADSRERMREEVAGQETALVAEQLVGTPGECRTGGVAAIVVRMWLPDESNVWRYVGAEE